MTISVENRAALLAFMTACVTLATQILVHRIVSAKLLNNFAFLVISLTMIGFAISGVVLSSVLKKFLDKLHDAVNLCSSLFLISIILCTSIFYQCHVGSQYLVSRIYFIKNFLHYMPLALLFAIPFVFCGFILGALLSSQNFATRRIYFYDLLGSAVGAIAVLPAITYLGVEYSILILSGLMVIITLILFPPRFRMTQITVVFALMLLFLSAVFSDSFFRMTYPEKSMLSRPDKYYLEHIAWDPIARIEMSRIIDTLDPQKSSYPCLIGGNKEFLAKIKRILTQNNYAFTLAVDYDGQKSSLAGIGETIYSAAYQVNSVPNPRVAIIGVGGGIDVLTSLNYDASEIYAIEVNLATLKILTQTYKEYFKYMVEDPRVNLIHAEGRHFLLNSDRKFDIIQLSGVDTYSGTAGSAHVFSESYLYTIEAMKLYYSRLTEKGIINVMRLELHPPREMLRALTTAVAALRQEGVQDPGWHIIMVTSNQFTFTAMLIKKTPFTQAETHRLEQWSLENKYVKISASRGLTPPPQTIYQGFIEIMNPKLEERFASRYPFNIMPVDDNKPFFFRYSCWWHLYTDNLTILQSIPVMEISLIILFILVSCISLVCIYVPLRLLSRKLQKPPATWRYGLLFASVGVGYLEIEISLLQKFGLFLGHPNYALSIVLASLLFTTGLGSLFYRKTMNILNNLRFVSYALTALILIEYFLFPIVFKNCMSFGVSIKAFIVFLFIFPLGILLGTFMPYALDRLKIVESSFIPWAWGVNGIFSVLSPIISVGISISWGINALMLSAIPVYIIAGLAFPDES